MKKDDFKTHTRYTVTLRDAQGRLKPANLYVYRLYDAFMIARRTDQNGLLCKIAYEDVLKIVRTQAVQPEDQFYIPDAVLKEATWAQRTTMDRYSTSPHMGK
ncbi:MAG TPA: hypothetical protein VFN52_00585 [Acidiferrobacteraceae bacterium]|nr:hypothetical protein [Acidiferrobacteraceae bacterium]